MGGFRRRWTAAGLGRRPARGPVKPLGGGGGAVLPTTNLVLQLDARSGVTESGGAGTGVSGWADQSAGANDATQTNASKRPAYTTTNAAFNSHPTVDFDGSTSSMLLTGWTQTSGPRTFYVVHRTLSVGAVNDGYLLDSQTGRLVYIVAAPGGALEVKSGAGAIVASTVVDPQLATTTIFTVDGSDLYFQSGASSQSQTGTTAADVAIGGAIAIGARNNETLAHYNGEIAAMFVYEAAHGSSERSNVLAYISQEWGV